MDPLALQIEAVIFCSSEPISVQELAFGLQETFEAVFESETIEKCLLEIRQKFANDSFVFELIKEEFQTDQEKYRSKIKHQSYYQRLVQALDPEVIESKFNELYDACTAEEELSEDDDLYELHI